MIRPATALCMVLAAASGLYLYQVKQRTRMLDRAIAATVKETQAAGQRIGVLKAEWTLLNQPDRLSELAQRYLALKPVAPGQFVTAADLDQRLASLAPAGPAAEETQQDSQEAKPIEKPITENERKPATVAVIQPVPAKPQPALHAEPPARQVAGNAPSAREKPIAQDRTSASAQPAPAQHGIPKKPSETRVATGALAPRPTELPLAAPRRAEAAVGASVLHTAVTHPAEPQARPASAPPVFRVGRGFIVSTPVTSSALGMGTPELPPPVPVPAEKRDEP
jgi:hypothetical protein